MTKEVKVWKTDYTANIDAEILDDVRSKHPNKFISISFDTHLELSELSNRESVCWGDGKSFVIILTNK